MFACQPVERVWKVVDANKVPTKKELEAQKETERLHVEISNPVRDPLVNRSGVPIKKLAADEEIERLLGQVWRNPFDVMKLDKEATDEEIRKSFKMLSLVLHPDKCQDPRATDCFAIVEQSYKTLLDGEKRKIFQKIMREAWERTEYDRERENKKRVKAGITSLPEDSFFPEYKANCRKIFDEIEDKKAHYLR